MENVYEFLAAVYRNVCIVCYQPANHPHHVIPKSAGGSDRFDNIVPLCYRCHADIHEMNAHGEADKLEHRAALIRIVLQTEEIFNVYGAITGAD